jgi:GH15 family glucan-1,4-alpha-glucosidase
VERTARELAPHGLVRRYLDIDDGLPGGEASFVICSFRLVDNLALAGHTEQAWALFERLLSYANDVVLLAEEIDPVSGELLGNFPQAFSHVGLISAAIHRTRPPDPQPTALNRGVRPASTSPWAPASSPSVTRSPP